MHCKMNLPWAQKIGKVLFRAACYLLLLANLVYVAIRYFNYETDSNVGFYTPVNFTSPNLSLCFDLNTILGKFEPLTFHQHRPKYVGLRDEDLFNKLPGVNEILNKCAYRDSALDQFKLVTNASECVRIFNIKRYRMQGLMCYLFSVNESHPFSFNSLAFSLNEPRILYKLVIAAPLNAGHTIVPLVHFDELADVDRIYMKELFPSRRRNEIFYLEYDLFEYISLKYPYKTNCAPQPKVKCYYDCLSYFYSRHGLSGSTAIARESSNVTTRVASYSDPEVVELYKSVDVCCLAKCVSEACEQKLVITHTSGPFLSMNHKLTFKLGSYKFPINRVMYSPKLTLLDFLTQCFSLSGIWVGFSVVSAISFKKKLDIASAYKNWQCIRLDFNHKLPYPTLRLNCFRGHSRRLVNRRKRRVKMGKKIACAVYKLIIFIAFCVQAISLCLLYSKYQTILLHDHLIDPMFDFALPSTAICINLEDLFPLNASRTVTEANYDILSKNRWSNLTLKQIFSQSMGEEILSQCRTPHFSEKAYFSGRYDMKYGKECLQDFTYRKYYFRWQVCYMFSPKKLFRPYRQLEFVFRETNPSKLYSLILHPRVSAFEQIDLITFFDPYKNNEVPYTSSEFRAISPRVGDKRVVMLTYHTLSTKDLPRPYDTKCNPIISGSKCRNACAISGLKKLHLLPYGSNVFEGVNWKLLSLKQLKNVTVNEYWTKLEQYCHEKCHFTLCTNDFTFTYVSHSLGRAVYNVELILNAETKPRTFTQSVPRFPFYDFYYQIFCLCAFWMGFSFIGLDFIRKRRAKFVTENIRLLHAESMKILLKLGWVKCKVVRSSGRSAVRRAICNLICVIGMCVHLVFPISDYLCYPSILLTTTTGEKPGPYKLMLCSEVEDLYEKGIIFKSERAKKNDVFDKSINEILKEAQNSIKLEYLCGYWGLSKDINNTNDMKRSTDRIFFVSNNSSLCSEMLKTRIFFKQSDICFQFSLRRNFNWTRTQMLHSLNEVKTSLTVSVDSSLISSRFTVLAHFDEGFDPFHSTIWSPMVRKQSRDSRYIVSYRVYIVVPLPFPYSDKGFTPGHITYCFYECANHRLSRFNLSRIYLGDHLTYTKFISNSVRNNNGVFNLLINEIDFDCDRKCYMTNFVEGWDSFEYWEANSMPFMVTLISEPLPYVGPRKGLTRFDLRRTDDPVIKMRFLISIFFSDLIINVGSVISIWFGISVINIPHLMTERGAEQIYNEAQDHFKRAKFILDQIPARNTNSAVTN